MIAVGSEHDTERIAALGAEAERRFGRFIRESVNPGADDRDRSGKPLPRALLSEGRAFPGTPVWHRWSM